jgi:2-oxoglutarate ferredoxin oxidoreductase subunit beta
MNAEAAVKEKIVETPKTKSERPIMHCPGCHYGIIIRLICETLEELNIDDKAVLLGGVGCSYGWPLQFDLDGTGCPHGRAPAMATALKRIHKDSIIITCQGDGDLGAIGLGCFMNALQRAERLTTIFLNNAGYGMTGGQMAPTTLLDQVTTTTPAGRDPDVSGYPLHVAELAAQFKGVVYSARVSVHTPANRQRAKKALKKAFQKQIDGTGYGLVEFLSACPSSWKMQPLEGLNFIDEKMIAEFPLGEFKDVEKIE